MLSVRKVIEGQQLYSVDSKQNTFDVARFMSEKGIGAVVVMEGDRLHGIFSERDLLKRVIVGGRDVHTTPVGEVATRDITVASPDEPVECLLAKMKQGGFRHLPIVDGGRLIGIVSLRDLLQHELCAKDEEIELMNTYIYYVPPSRA